MNSRLFRAATLTGAAALGYALLAGGTSSAKARTIQVSGFYSEHAVTGPECTSPVGLCIAAEYRGGIRGALAGNASAIIATADTPATDVSAFTSDSTLTATIRGRTGTLLIKNAGVFSSTDGGPIVDVQTVVGGTGDLAGASGSIRASGTFSFANGGRSEYTGTVVLP